jgi:UDP-N-acetylglucosamine--N-acetylmuramyl-(pentapeptide) pyrophosphoryl-undecaprenol N-acetylglucosamine transferase
LVGNPVRRVIVESKIPREEGVRFFGLDPAKTTILSTGGSLGARGINEAVAAHIDEFGKNDLQLIWQTGKPFAEQAAGLSVGRNNIWTRDFIPQMEYAFAAADIVISRSGAMSIAELCVVRKPVVFVPFPYAAEDHQTVNAENLVRKNAGLMVKDSEAKEKLVAEVLELASDKNKQAALTTNIGRLAVTDAAGRIAAEILKAIKE